jgi:hypothetical protein
LQEDWADWLPLAEFAANNQASEATGVSPFFGMYGMNPRCQFDLSPPLPNNHHDRLARETVEAFSTIHDHLRSEMVRAQLRYQDQADAHCLPAPNYQVGDRVWLDARNWKTRRLAHKLDNKLNGLFRVLRVLSPYAYRLGLADGTSAKSSFGLPNMLPRRPNCMDASANSIAKTGVFYNRHISRIL